MTPTDMPSDKTSTRVAEDEPAVRQFRDAALTYRVFCTTGRAGVVAAMELLVVGLSPAHFPIRMRHSSPATPQPTNAAFLATSDLSKCKWEQSRNRHESRGGGALRQSLAGDLCRCRL